MGALRCLIAAAMCSLAVWASDACAAALQVSPVTVELRPGENATGITLLNSGDRALYGQVRIFRWEQRDGQDTLTPAQDLIASPPLIEVAPRSDQLVRLVRASDTPVATEQSYRLLIDELPSPTETPLNGVMIRLRYSVPVFIEPVAAAGLARLSWHLSKAVNGWTLRVQNSGTRRAQIAALTLVNASGQLHNISKGLLGYALAGREGQWAVSLPSDWSGTGTMKVRALVNSLPVEAGLTVDQSD